MSQKTHLNIGDGRGELTTPGKICNTEVKMQMYTIDIKQCSDGN